MDTLKHLACAALLAANMLAPASPQLVDVRLPKSNRLHTTRLQRDDRRAKMRKLVDVMSMPTIPVPDPPQLTPPPSTPVPFPSPGSPTDEPTITISPTATPNAPIPTHVYPTKKPAKPTRKPTKNPMRPTRKPSRKPTKKPGSSTRSFDSCKPREHNTTVERYDGKNFHFRWNETYGPCVDLNNSLYEFGEFDVVDSFADCAQACLRDVNEKLTRTTVLRGIDYVCESEEGARYYYEGKCRCLYENGTIESNIEAVEESEFDETSDIGVGAGPVQGISTQEDYLAGKTFKTLCGAIHFDDLDEYENFDKVALG